MNWPPPMNDSAIDVLLTEAPHPGPPRSAYKNTVFPGWSRQEILDYLTNTPSSMKENTMSTNKIRNVIVEQLEEHHGWDAESINGLIDEVNDVAKPDPRWERVAEPQTVRITLEVSLCVDDVNVTDDMDSDELFEAALTELGVRYCDDLVNVVHGNEDSVAFMEAEVY